MLFERSHAADVQRLAHQAVFNDGVIDQSDIARVVEAKRRLLETASVIRFDFDGVELSNSPACQS